MIEILKEQNPHWDNRMELMELMPRYTYLEKLKLLLNRREMLVITGIRRAGKSALLKLLIGELLDAGIRKENLFYLNLEDYRLGTEKDIGLLDKAWALYQEKVQPTGPIYAMFDEIQEVEFFEKWVRTNYDLHPNVKFIITGSSSTLTSGEIATLLTGRQLTVEVFPFSFPEYVQFHNEKLSEKLVNQTAEKLNLSKISGQAEVFLDDYLKLGGFPEVVKHADHSSNIMLLQQYLGDILLKDISRRYNIRKIQALQRFAAYLISNIANEINIKRSAALLGINRSTVIDLMSYLREVYLVQTTSCFSFSLNERLNTTKPKKVYCIDNGFFTAVKQMQTFDLGKRAENLVHQQIKFHWQEEVFYWKGKVEIDFTLGNGFPINVTMDDALPERETTGLFYYLSQFNLRKGLLVSWNRFDTIEENGRKITVIPLWIFLTKSKDEIEKLAGE